MSEVNNAPSNGINPVPSPKSTDTPSKYAKVAAITGAIASLVLMGLSITNKFGPLVGLNITDKLGPLGSINGIASLTGGGILGAVSTGGIVGIARAEALAIKPYPKEGQEAIAFARCKLKENPDLEPSNFRGGWGKLLNPPLNQEIALLTTLYYKKYGALESLLEVLHDQSTPPWSDPKVIEAADELMKISYAVSCLTLEELPAFTQNLFETKEIKRTFQCALTYQDSYQYRTSFFCPVIYHNIRGAIEAIDNPDFDPNFAANHPDVPVEDYPYENPSLVFRRQKPVPEEHEKSFYMPFYAKESTTQAGWRALYNDYCDRLRCYAPKVGSYIRVDGEILEAWTDRRILRWTQKDTGKNFVCAPTTRPT